MQGMASRSLLLLIATAGLLVQKHALAVEPVRLHGTVDGAKAFGGQQGRELGFGPSGFMAGELPLIPAVGLQVELGGVWLSDGKAPTDPDLADNGAASAAAVGVGVRVRPFATRAKEIDLFHPSGIWLSTAGAITRTGDLTRPAFNVQAGWDAQLGNGAYGLGPTAGYLHVFQPDDQLRSDDAHIVMVGIHAFFDFGRYGAMPPRDLDSDGDGLIDKVDQCPTEPEDKDGFEDEDGCPDPDNDQDGILDDVDRCRDVPEDPDGFEDDDGCPEEDNDRDGIKDPDDECPLEPEDKDGFEDADGCPDPDNDQDGIADVEDLCPNEPETQNGYADHDGCPDEEQVRVVGDKIVLDDRVHFRTNNATIRPLSHPLLERLAKLLTEHPEYIHVHIEGHADQRGDEKFNLRLSTARAESVKNFLVERGVAESRLSYEGFGSSQPLVDSSDPRAYFLNRRVEFRVTREVAADTAKPPAGAAADPGGESKDESGTAADAPGATADE
jgi:outer membrane protein OmpA-like peptidoglycan-associated protein